MNLWDLCVLSNSCLIISKCWNNCTAVLGNFNNRIYNSLLSLWEQYCLVGSDGCIRINVLRYFLFCRVTLPETTQWMQYWKFRSTSVTCPYLTYLLLFSSLLFMFSNGLFSLLCSNKLVRVQLLMRWMVGYLISELTVKRDLRRVELPIW